MTRERLPNLALAHLVPLVLEPTRTGAKSLRERSPRRYRHFRLWTTIDSDSDDSSGQ